MLKINDLLYPIIIILFWVAVWSINDIIMTLLFKESIMLKLGVYLSMLAIVFFFILLNPEFVNRI